MSPLALRSPEYYALKRRAYSEYQKALRDGRLMRQPCERCGTPKAAGHHRDYSKPLEVVWLCIHCHSDEHIRLGLERRDRELRDRPAA